MKSVRQIRKERGWSQERTAAEAGIDRVTLVHIETGKSSPTVDTLQKLASALAVEVGDFFPKAQGALFSPDDPPVGRGADEAAAEPLRVLNECLHGMQQAYAPGRELNWSRETLEDVSALVAKTAVRVADAGLAAGGNDSFVEAVQIISRARHVMQLLDERAADAPSQATGPPPENAVVELRETLRQFSVPELRAG
jgi:transcriptional regulator with XRE-family HTH domain